MNNEIKRHTHAHTQSLHRVRSILYPSSTCQDSDREALLGLITRHSLNSLGFTLHKEEPHRVPRQPAAGSVHPRCVCVWYVCM